MLKILRGEASKYYKRKKSETERSKIMCKYVQLKRFHNDRRLQVYMYSFMYVDPQTIPVEDNFTATKNIVVN